jgi:hypothetical protein
VTITSIGYTGTINATQWAAQTASYVGRSGVSGDGQCVGSATDWQTTIVAGVDRTVRIAPGTGYGFGVVDVNDATFDVQLPIASGTVWYAIIARRHWTTTPTNSTVFGYVTGSASLLLPTGLSANPGVEADQPIALVQITSGTTSPTDIIDLRRDRTGRFYDIRGARTYATSALAAIDNPMEMVDSFGGQWADLTLPAPLVTFDGTRVQARRRRNIVYMRGAIARASGTFAPGNVSMFTLGVGYRPYQRERYSIATSSQAGAWVTIDTSGVVVYNSSVATSWFYLSGINFEVGN